MKKITIQLSEIRKALTRVRGITCQRLVAFLLLSVFAAGGVLAQESASAQRVILSGKVVDATNIPIIGASVFVEGTTFATTTNADGDFSLTASITPASKLQVAFIGMEPYIVTIGSERSFLVELKDDSETLEAAVVTGFQSISKAAFTGSSAVVKAEDLKVKGAVDVSRMLEGQVAGVTIQNVSGTFGSAPKVRVRGATSLRGENKPLWVIDGVVQEDITTITNDQLTSGDPTTLLGSAIAGLNGNDIESINVLKDAAATALYGARAMNGVVVVTTKKGQEGRPRVSYSGSFSINLRPSYSNYDIMNSAEQMSVYAEMERKGLIMSDIVNDANSGVYGKMYNLINTFDSETGNFYLENTPEARKAFLTRYAYANTDWFKVLFRNSLVQDHSVSISSGTKNSNSYSSISYMGDNGWSVADKVHRLTANLRNNYNITDKFTVGVLLTGSVRKQDAPGTVGRVSNVVDGGYERDFDINPFSYAINTSRALTPYDENGNLEFFTRNYAPFNILHEIENNKIKLSVVDVKAQVDLKYNNILPGLSWDFLGAARYVKSDREHEIHETANMAEAYRAAGTSTIRGNNKFLYTDPDNPDGEPEIVLPYGGFYNTYEDIMTNFDVRNSISYTKELGKHTISVFGGQQIKYADRQKKSFTGNGYQYDKGGTVMQYFKYFKQMIENNYYNFAMGTTRDRFVAFYLNADYVFDAKYVFAVTARYDGSNAMGRKRSARWFPTWTVSGKWNAGEEKFIKDIPWINELGVRLSYGLTGSMAPYANSSVVYLGTVSSRARGDEFESYIDLDALENSELTWEKSYSLNAGLDLNLFKNRIRFSFDVWQRKNFDLIDYIKVSGIGGKTRKYANYADMKSYGIDVALTGKPIVFKDFEWTSTISFGTNNTDITRAEYNPRIVDMIRADGGNLQGYPVNSLFSLQYVGLSEEGVPEFINENGEVSSNVYLQSTNLTHLKYEGTIDPKVTGGFSNTFRYKNLSLNVFLTFQAGNKIRLAPAFSKTYSDFSSMPKAFYNRWVTPGDETSIPTIVDTYVRRSQLGSINPYSAYNYSTERIAKGDFLRVKTISVTYDVPSKWVEKTNFFKSASATAAISNFWMLYADKKLNGQDPEFFNTGGVATPIQKQVTFALKFTF